MIRTKYLGLIRTEYLGLIRTEYLGWGKNGVPRIKDDIVERAEHASDGEHLKIGEHVA